MLKEILLSKGREGLLLSFDPRENPLSFDLRLPGRVVLRPPVGDPPTGRGSALLSLSAGCSTILPPA